MSCEYCILRYGRFPAAPAKVESSCINGQNPVSTRTLWTTLARSTSSLGIVPVDSTSFPLVRMPTSKSRPYTTIDGLAHDAPREYLHQCHPADLVKAILCLRTKNKELCKLVIPARNSSQAKDQSPHSSVSSRKPCESQQGDFPRTIKGVDLANKKVRELKLEVEELKTEIETRAKEADEKANSLVSIEEELQGERAKVEEAEKQRRKTLNELAAAIRTEGNLYDDNHFRGEVETLRRSIDNSWVRNQIWRVVDEQNPSPNFKPYQFLKEVCHNYHEYIYNPIALRTLVHAFVWDVLGREVFGQNIWAQSSKELPGPDGQGSTRNPFSAWQAHIGMFLFEKFGIMYLTQLH